MQRLAAERDLGDGLRPRSAGDRTQTARSHHRRYVLTVLAGAGAALLLPGYACRRGYWKESGERWDCRQRSGSTRAPSLWHATWICGLTDAASRSTSPGQENRPTMHLSRPSMADSDPSV